MGTSFHASTHGGQASFGDSFATPTSGDNRYIDLDEITAAVGSKGATTCQHNFVFLDACYSSDTAIWHNVFGTTSFLGWIGPTNSTATVQNWVNAFWDGLAMQKTVAQARAYADQQQSGVTNDSARGSTSYKVHLTY